MRNLLEVCCGLDVHKEVLVACMLKGGIDEESVTKKFSTLLSGLDEFKGWMIENGCWDVAMESTGVYWFPIYNVLESIFKKITMSFQNGRNRLLRRFLPFYAVSLRTDRPLIGFRPMCSLHFFSFLLRQTSV